MTRDIFFFITRLKINSFLKGLYLCKAAPHSGGARICPAPPRITRSVWRSVKCCWDPCCDAQHKHLLAPLPESHVSRSAWRHLFRLPAGCQGLSGAGCCRVVVVGVWGGWQGAAALLLRLLKVVNHTQKNSIWWISFLRDSACFLSKGTQWGRGIDCPTHKNIKWVTKYFHVSKFWIKKVPSQPKSVLSELKINYKLIASLFVFTLLCVTSHKIRLCWRIINVLLLCY